MLLFKSSCESTESPHLLFKTILEDKFDLDTNTSGILPEHKIDSNFEGTENCPALFSNMTKLISAVANTCGKSEKS